MNNYVRPSGFYRQRMIYRMLGLTSLCPSDRLDSDDGRGKKWRTKENGEKILIIGGRVADTWLPKRIYARFCKLLRENSLAHKNIYIRKYIATPLHIMDNGDTPKIVLSAGNVDSPKIIAVFTYPDDDTMFDALKKIGGGNGT